MSIGAGKLKDISDYGSVLLVEEPNSMQETTSAILKKLQDKKVIYIALIRPHDSVLSRFTADGVKTDKLFFIDCVTESAGGNVSARKNVLFVREPTDLSGISISVQKLAQSADSSEKWIVLDALRILTIYNKENVVIHFVQNLLESATRYDAKTVVLATKGKDQELIKKVSQYFEKVVGF